MDCSLPVSSAHEFPRQKQWSGLPFPSPIYVYMYIYSFTDSPTGYYKILGKKQNIDFIEYSTLYILVSYLFHI